MVGKKPAKPIAGQKKETGPVLPGKINYYSGGKFYPSFVCVTCGSTRQKGFIFEQGNIFYCRRICIPSNNN